MAIEDVVINVSAQEIEAMAKRHISQEITEDSSVEELASAKAVYDALKNAGGDGGGGDSIAPLIVTADIATLKASHTATEIYDHALVGGQVLLAAGNGSIYLAAVSPVTALFELCGETDATEQNQFQIDADGNVTYVYAKFATADQIGDISAALDELHTYARVLITGGAAE